MNLDNITLMPWFYTGYPSGPRMSLMEAVAEYAGEPRSPAPRCVSHVLRAYAHALADAMTFEGRQDLREFIPLLAGTAGDGLDAARAWLALDWLVRTGAPAFLDAAGLEQDAAALRACRPLTTLTVAQAASPVVNRAREHAAQAWDASPARASRGAEMAARDTAMLAADAAKWYVVATAVHSYPGPGEAWTAAGAPAWTAGFDAAAAAAGAAGAGLRPGAAVKAALTALAPAVLAQSRSAVDLLRAMIRPEAGDG